MDDVPQVEQLENRIDELEATIEKMMPSRRDALKMGGAALAGGSLMAGTASAGSNQVGTIGDKDATPPKLVDIHSEDINNADTVTTQDLVVNGTANGGFEADISRIFFDVLTEPSTNQEVMDFEQNGTARGNISTGLKKSVGTSDTAIINYGGLGMLALVNGDDGIDRFCDILVAVRGGSVDVIGTSVNGSPPNRSYAEKTGQIDLSVSSGTVDVGVVFVKFSTPL